MSQPIVSFKNVTKKFPGIVANNNITLDIEQGEIFALLGENGAGKSVLMSMLFGMFEPDEGEIWVRGKKVEHYSPRAASEMNIGMVHQHFKLVENYTIAENIVLGTEPVRKVLGVPIVDMARVEQVISELSKKYRLEVNPTDVIEDVNVATRQRVEILKMLYREAEILIFDEPSAILTPQEIEYLLDIIRGMRDLGKTVILITHKLEEIKQVADRCAILNRGRLVEILDVATTSTKTMANLMVGREVEMEPVKANKDFGPVVLSVQNLSVKNENGLEVVKSVSFDIRGGEIFAVAGVSGNGQEEIANAITGLQKVSGGSVILNGQDVTDWPIRERNLRGISYIPEDRQAYGLVLDFELGYNLVLKNYFKEPFSKNGILRKDEIQRYAERLIEEYDIRSSQGATSSTRSLSGGNQQKAIIGREIEENSPLMVFVQPTRGLDVGAIANTWEQIIRERDEGKAILLISLELDEIMALADTVGVLYSGELLKVESAGKLSANEIGEYMMGVKHEGA